VIQPEVYRKATKIIKKLIRHITRFWINIGWLLNVIDFTVILIIALRSLYAYIASWVKFISET